MIYHSKSLDLEITDFEYQYDRTPSGEITPSQTSNP